MLCIPGQAADMVYIVLVDLVDGHVEADIVRCRLTDIMQDRIVGVATDGVMPLPIAVQTQEDQIRFRQINGEGTVGNHIDDQKAHCLGFDDQVTERFLTVPPEKGFSSAEEQNPHAHIVQGLHFLTDFFIGVDYRSNIIDRAVLAVQVTLICNDNCAQNRFLFS